MAGLAASLAANLLLLSLVHTDWLGLRAASGAPRSVALSPLSDRSWEANRRITDGSRPAPPAPAPRAPASPRARAEAPRVAAPATPAPATPTPPAPEALAQRQVVDVAPGNDKVPNESRLLAETNNSVEKESVSRDAKAGAERTTPRPTQSTTPVPVPKEIARQAERPAPEAGSPGGDAKRPGAPGAAEPSPGSPQRPSDRLALNLDPAGLRLARPPEAAPPSAAQQPGAGGEGGTGSPDARRGEPILKPTEAFYGQMAGNAFPDYVQGADVGDATFLNTREWKYAGFFNRIKQSVAENWDPGTAIRARDPKGDRFMYKDRDTVLAVTLGRDGALKEVRVARSSGIDFLDQTAVDAFSRSQPFLNPPPGLLDPRGEVHFSFGFHVETGGGGLFRFFRPPGQ